MELTWVLHYPHYCCAVGTHPARVRSSTQSALWAHSADCHYYLRLSFRCGNPQLDLDFQLQARALAH